MEVHADCTSRFSPSRNSKKIISIVLYHVLRLLHNLLLFLNNTKQLPALLSRLHETLQVSGRKFQKQYKNLIYCPCWSERWNRNEDYNYRNLRSL